MFPRCFTNSSLAFFFLYLKKNNSEPVSSASRYAVACSAVTFALTLCVVLAHLSPVSSTLFVGTKVEGVVTIVLVAFWAAIVAVNTDADLDLAPPSADSNSVQSANLYYFSWAGFVTSLILLVGFIRDSFGFDAMGTLHAQGKRMQWWAALLACSIVVMGSASQTLGLDCRGDDRQKPSGYCPKTRFAIAVGTIGSLLSLLVISSQVIKYTAGVANTPFLLELGSSALLTILNALGVAFTTSASGPGAGIGNLYYFSWASFLLSAVLGVECYGEFVNPPAPNETTTMNGNGNTYPDNGDVAVETFDDNI